MADKPSDPVVYLHGDLALHIIEARGLPNMDLLSEHLRKCFACEPCKSTTADDSTGGDIPPTGGVGDQKINRHRKIITSDPYITVCVPQTTLARTRVITNSQHPHWNERFTVALAHPVVNLEFQVKDDDVFGAELIGTVQIPAGEIKSGKRISGWFPVLAASGKSPKKNTAINLDLKFTPCEANPLYQHGIAGDPEKLGVRNTYFPLRKGGEVTLYQDAHVPDGMLPKIELGNGKVYTQPKCWEDLCYAISEAHHMIYVAGWSIYDKIKLVREPTRPLPRGGELNLGELLKYKSEEGVRVLMLVWDDKTSHNKFGIDMPGLMQTHDEDTRRFFKHSSVNCVLAPRYASSKLGYIKQQVVGTLFTHHQKCVLVDTQASGNYRKVTAFVGGIDLCDGRYDTPAHRLFHDLDTVFEGDFHNPTFAAGTKAPRQPWHDLHSKLEGPAAYDVLVNFEQRWRKATKWKEFGQRFKKKSQWHDDSLIKIGRISWILSPNLSVSRSGAITSAPDEDSNVHVTREDDPETWHVQVFRSIDSGSLKGFPKTVHAAKAQNLICSKDVAIDRSIQTAYIQAIRSAEHFIYIENQYFLGSSYGWPSYKDAGADNLIPMELALKIASKIRLKERFSVYIVVPLWPEGNPTSGPVQEILYWQSQTMQMMYGIVARELKSCQISDAHPLDYLNFYCLGNREELPQKMLSEVSPTNGDKVSDSYKFQRFMIYVHAKGMIVDDEYVIVGSANINQRSMAGTKDTELAMGAYQPHYSRPVTKHPRGQVYGYRMSLWAEHLGGVENTYDEPWSLKCVHRINQTAVENWKRFTDENFRDLQGHLLKYPLQVNADGEVVPIPGQEIFPDVGGKVIGAHSIKLPDTLTT